MIRANELRRGNLLLFRGMEFEVEDITSKYATHPTELGRYFYEELEPITLTEEWLLKFGFKELKRFTHDFEEVIYGKSIIHGFDNHSEMLVISMPFRHAHIGEYLIDEDYYLNIEIKHIHQLQNIYFALCGEELTIKE